MLAFLEKYAFELLSKAGEHLLVAMGSLALGILIAVPVAIALINHKKVAQIVISFCSVLQTIPSLALLAIMVPMFGVGKVPAVVALFIYSLLPILRNTYIGLQGVDENLLDAAKGMGMTQGQIIYQIQFPLAFPVVMSGIRLSAVYVIGWATIASYVGAGGLGDFIFAGLNNYNFYFIVSATVLVTTLALLIDLVLNQIEKHFTPITSSKKKEGVVSE